MNASKFNIEMVEVITRKEVNAKDVPWEDLQNIQVKYVFEIFYIKILMNPFESIKKVEQWMNNHNT